MAEQFEKTLCRMCNDRCALNVVLADGRITKVTGLKGHPWSEGKICIKAKASTDMVYAKDRLLKPLKKVKNDWLEISLEEALDEIAFKLEKLKRKYGARCLSVWKGEAVGFAQQEQHARRFCQALGSPNYFSNDSTCFCARWIAYSLVYGGGLVPDYENADCIVIWGSNPPFSHPFAFEKILKARKNGAKLIVIDPRKNEIARKADLHAMLKPGTDGALAWGLINYLIEKDLYATEFLEHYSIGFDAVQRYARRFTLAYTAKETGIPANLIEQIALNLAKNSPRSLNIVGNGLEHHVNGLENIRAIAFIDAIIGSIDHKGGSRLPEGPGLQDLELYNEIDLSHLNPIGSKKYPLLYNFRQESHTMTGLNSILTGQPYRIRGMLLTAANPVLTNPAANKVKEALSSLELLVVRDLFMTETASLAHYVLPAASFYERSEFHVFPAYNVINLTKKLISLPECQDEYQFWHDLAHRLGLGHYFPWDNESTLNEWLLKDTGITNNDLETNPEGYQYKPITYEKWKNSPFKTPSGKIEFTSGQLEKLGYHSLPEYRFPAYLRQTNPEYPFTLISGSRKKLYNSSRYHNLEQFQKLDPQPYVGIHPEDALQLGIQDYDLVRISSAIGSLEIQAEVLPPDAILSGYIQVPYGWSEANVNLITPDDRNDPMSGFPSLKAVPVRIEKLTPANGINIESGMFNE
ncbi:molybdopterin-dependent oxidoreductase [Candidatus Chlorohelix sp.]|uniref:molybdopterin-containing oxidoreductase family protein n=1 Tax=Candidatus Chlorohelix sp. TaxID=3139201 RepID=UPI00302A9E61